jgi:mono/diheme cytochrome c family protein
MKRLFGSVLLISMVLLLAACSAAATPTSQPVATPIPIPATSAPTVLPSATLSPTAIPADTPSPVPTTTAAPLPAVPATETPSPTAEPTTVKIDAETGRQVWQTKECIDCHGDNAEGDRGPTLAGTGLTVDAVLLQVRTGKGRMPAFTADEVSDVEVQQIYAWLRSLPRPTPEAVPTAAATVASAAPTATTAARVAPQPPPIPPSIPPPDYPTVALNAFWVSVNDLKVKSDFTKDVPARQAQDDAGRLAVLKGYAGEAVGLGQQALAQGNQALAEVPRESVQVDLRQALAAVQQIVDQANQALGRDNYEDAYQDASAMARLSRIEAWPWATQAVRDAGLTGTVRVRVTNRAGQPIANAFVTVLTAHDPAAALTDANGRATIVNAAAVPALQVKAYAAGLVYHEVHVNLTPGTTADAAIALPGANPGGQAPVVSAATTSTGSGSRVVSLRMTASDPQGASDLAEDQLFALNPALGAAFVLQAAGVGQYGAQIQLPVWATGPQTWYFFAVDHACNTSNVVIRQYPTQ